MSRKRRRGALLLDQVQLCLYRKPVRLDQVRPPGELVADWYQRRTGLIDTDTGRLVSGSQWDGWRSPSVGFSGVLYCAALDYSERVVGLISITLNGDG